MFVIDKQTMYRANHVTTYAEKLIIRANNLKSKKLKIQNCDTCKYYGRRYCSRCRYCNYCVYLCKSCKNNIDHVECIYNMRYSYCYRHMR